MTDAARVCPACGASNPGTNAYCNICGARLTPAAPAAPAAGSSAVTCPNCGAVNEGPGNFCAECGARLPAPAAAAPPPPPSAAGWGAPPPPPLTPPPALYPSPFNTAPAMPFRQEIAGYASFWRRLGALLLDLLILIVPAIFVAIIALILFDDDRVRNFVTWLASACYFWILNSQGGTLGKRILGIKVIDEAGNPPGLGKGFIRAIIPVWLGVFQAVTGSDTPPIVGLIGLFQVFDGLWMIWDGNKQTLHDKMAGTRVVKL